MKGDPAEVLESYDGVNLDGEAINAEVASENRETSARIVIMDIAMPRHDLAPR